ncbi:MAG: aspartate aminotransferase family protein [Candidatus Marinimicrobia bacterium]|nr:aspartate aminotransferase family protein [Candidatus Neomarinimicrobiota bacterium]
MLRKRRKNYLGPSLSLSYDEPLHIIKGKGQFLFDKNGKKYLDAVNNIQHVGHCHPKITEAFLNQNEKLNTNTRYLDETILNYAEALLEKLPAPLSKCYFTNSGSESNDLALRMARNRVKSLETIVLDGAYHGHLTSLIEVSPYKYNGLGGEGAVDHVHAVPMPDPYRGKYRGPDSGSSYANEIKTLLDELTSKGKKVSSFIAESVMGCGGQIFPPKGFINMAYEEVRRSGGVCIADEVQIGFGRLGEHFWGFESHDVVPDIVTLGKSIGNGHPLSVLVTTDEMAEDFNNGMEYFNSFGGNPVSCTIGIAVLEILEEEQLQENAMNVGSKLLSMLSDIKSRYSEIGDVRGKGLFMGIEFIQNKTNLEPDGRIASLVVNEMKNKGILLSTDGPDHNVIKIKPPLVFNDENAHYLAENLDATLSKVLEMRKNDI